MSHPYRALLGVPAVRIAYLSVLLSAIPLGTVTLALILSIESWSGSLALAGSIAALFTFGNAVGLTVQGALIDRFGDRLVLVLAGLASSGALGGIALAGASATPVVLGALAGVAGLAVPAVTAAVRRRLPALVSDPTARSAGYAVLSVIFQLAFAGGPLLVSVAIGITGRASDSIFVAGVVIVVAVGVFVVAGFPSADHPRPSVETHGERFALRPLVALYGVAALTGFATGVAMIAIPAVLASSGAAVLAGVAFAAIALGDVAGAVVFGSRQWPMTERMQLATALLMASAAALVVFLLSGWAGMLVAAVAVTGAAGAPVAIRLSSLLDEFARPGSLGLAYSVLVSVGLLASACGTAVAGQIGTLLEPRLLLIGPPVVLLSAAVLARRAIR